jgi:hypothetical protein
MSGKKSYRKNLREHVLHKWNEFARATEQTRDQNNDEWNPLHDWFQNSPEFEFLETKLKEARRGLTGIPLEDPIWVHILDSAAEWTAAVARAGEQVNLHLSQWMETCHASLNEVENILPLTVGESSPLHDLYRFNLGLSDDDPRGLRFVRDSWSSPHGSRSMVHLNTHQPSSTEFISLVAVEWSLLGYGRKKMPQAFCDLANATLQILTACAAFLILDDGTALVCRRPLELHFDQQGRLGRRDGPAVVWANGETAWWLGGVAFPSHLQEFYGKIYCRDAMLWPPNPAIDEDTKILLDLNDGLVEPVRPKPSEFAEMIRQDLSNEPDFAGFFCEEDLRAGYSKLLDAVGPIRQGERVVMLNTELHQVVRGDEERHYLCEILNPDAEDYERVIEVPNRFYRVEAALAWTFNPVVASTPPDNQEPDEIKV